MLSGCVSADGCAMVRLIWPASSDQGLSCQDRRSGRLARVALASAAAASTRTADPFHTVPRASARSTRPEVADRTELAAHCAGAMTSIVIVRTTSAASRYRAVRIAGLHFRARRSASSASTLPGVASLPVMTTDVVRAPSSRSMPASHAAQVP